VYRLREEEGIWKEGIFKCVQGKEYSRVFAVGENFENEVKRLKKKGF
jgi:hypothetical protein